MFERSFIALVLNCFFKKKKNPSYVSLLLIMKSGVERKETITPLGREKRKERLGSFDVQILVSRPC